MFEMRAEQLLPKPQWLVQEVPQAVADVPNLW